MAGTFCCPAPRAGRPKWFLWNVDAGADLDSLVRLWDAERYRIDCCVLLREQVQARKVNETVQCGRSFRHGRIQLTLLCGIIHPVPLVLSGVQSPEIEC
jgi:hypothetical protein